jgi:hypothetical protein
LYQDKKGSGVSGATPLNNPRFKRLPNPSPSLSASHLQNVHPNSQKENSLQNGSPCAPAPGKTAGLGCRECRKALNYGNGCDLNALNSATPSESNYSLQLFFLYTYNPFGIIEITYINNKSHFKEHI